MAERQTDRHLVDVDHQRGGRMLILGLRGRSLLEHLRQRLPGTLLLLRLLLLLLLRLLLLLLRLLITVEAGPPDRRAALRMVCVRLKLRYDGCCQTTARARVQMRSSPVPPLVPISDIIPPPLRGERRCSQMAAGGDWLGSRDETRRRLRDGLSDLMPPLPPIPSTGQYGGDEP
uniref:Uncharacterized protein n=1 Tax=Anopheles melas TaxID=34690 RepID=A0A182UCH1_9DIPT